MSNIVTGTTIPPDLKVVLEKYGVDFDKTISFIVRCDGANEPLLITTTSYVEETPEETVKRGAFEPETRTFKLLAVE